MSDNQSTNTSNGCTPEQLKTWKAEYGECSILKIELRGETIYLLDPEKSKNYFHTVKRALQFTMQDDPASAGEVIFKECYLGGLGELSKIDTNTPLYFDLCIKCSNLCSIAEGDFTKA